MELKPIAVASALLTLFCLNCTVMELKLLVLFYPLLRLLRLNCTVMELKQKTYLYTWKGEKVLIVPLWN